ncbi:hypothetical protein C2E23DRAFT_698922, partial [Lenzites betulinus]
MPSHKRPASETLLPLRAPKQRRTTTHHPLGGNSSPSQNEALFARWTRLGMEFWSVLRDTVVSITSCEFGTPSDSDAMPSGPSRPHIGDYPQERAAMPSPPPSPPPPPPPRATTSARQLPPRPAIPTFSRSRDAHQSQPKSLSTSAPAANEIHERVQPQQPNPYVYKPILTKYASMQANAVASTSKSTIPPAEAAPKVSGFPDDTRSSGLMSPPSTQASESSIRSAITQTYPEISAALAETHTHRRKRSAKKYVEREHIHAKQHKARVQEEKKRTREEMEKDLKELYHIKRSAG